MSAVRLMALKAARKVATHYDASAWLDAYRMVLLDTQGWDALLPSAPRGALLDVGAGIGDVHLELARIFVRAVATETSRGAATRLRERGVDARVIDLSREDWPSHERFDLGSGLNVIDRADRPLALLDRAVSLVAPGGHLVIATPLPLRPHVHRAGGTADPDEWLGVEGETFESSLRSLVSRVLAPRGLTVTRWTRTPYVSSGDAHARRYDLDDAILVCAPAR